jgi:hypothetical protein
MIYLAFTLPENYVAHNWPATWIGFDCVLIAFMIATAVLGWLRRELVILPGFTTGVLLICDAWFDIMTAGPGQLWMSVVTAVLLNVPAADHGHRRGADSAADGDAPLVSRPRDAGVAPAVGAITRRWRSDARV